MGVKQRISVAEYLALPEEKPYLEYVNGEVCPKVAPDRKHSDIAVEIIEALAAYRRTHGGRSGIEGRVGFEDPADTRFLLPDVAYYAPGRPRGERIMLPPTLAVEIRSPGQTMETLRERCRYFRRHGIDVCWIIDPINRRAEVFEGDVDAEPRGIEDTLESEHLPGFYLVLDEIFEAMDADE